jgi:hypothetical protein
VDTFTIWMLCIVGMMVVYGIFAVYFSVTGAADDDQKAAQASDNQAAKGKGAAK